MYIECTFGSLTRTHTHSRGLAGGRSIENSSTQIPGDLVSEMGTLFGVKSSSAIFIMIINLQKRLAKLAKDIGSNASVYK